MESSEDSVFARGKLIQTPVSSANSQADLQIPSYYFPLVSGSFLPKLLLLSHQPPPECTGDWKSRLVGLKAVPNKTGTLALRKMDRTEAEWTAGHLH